MELQDKKSTTKGPADWFTGDVWVDPVAQGHGPTPTTVGLVHSTPGARTAWHAHEVAQTLYVTEGVCRAQSSGEPMVTIRAGDVVVAPGGEWHRHGAAPGHFMTHLAISEGGAEWGEHVTDADYNPDGH
jgi:quercetin dioxygenase-like cupin family protein